MKEDTEHWSIVEELDRKTLEAFDRINQRYEAGEISDAEAAIAYEMIYWMGSGLSREEYFLNLAASEATRLAKSARIIGTKSKSGEKYSFYICKGESIESFGNIRSSDMRPIHLGREVSSAFSVIKNRIPSFPDLEEIK